MMSQSSFFTIKSFLRKKPDNRKSSSTPVKKAIKTKILKSIGEKAQQDNFVKAEHGEGGEFSSDLQI